MNATKSTGVSPVEKNLVNYPVVELPSDTPLPGHFIVAKTKAMWVKHITSVINESDEVVRKFLIDTLEGTQQLGDNSFVCLGLEAEDIWQQDPEKLFKKYDLLGVNDKGWLKAVPKPENESNAILIQQERFAIVGQWGTDGAECDGEPGLKYQFGVAGDFILQNPTDLSDKWIVAKRIYDRSYEAKS